MCVYLVISLGPSQGTTPTTYEDLLRTNMSNPSNRNNGNGSRPSGGGRHQRGNQPQPTANARNGGQLPSSPAEEEALKSQIRKWPHNLSFLFAAFSATIGMFSISRFAVLTVEFGAGKGQVAHSALTRLILALCTYSISPQSLQSFLLVHPI